MKQKYCPITYDPISPNQTYSAKGLSLLSNKLSTLHDLPLSEAALRREARLRSTKMSIQGVQPKLSAVLSVTKSQFELVDHHGKYILKPPSDLYAELPENEAISMHLATLVGIEVPIHGLLYNSDKTFTYFIKRFDRAGHIDRLLVEDFSQLSGNTRETKYDFSMEKLVDIINTHCTFPMLEKKDLFIRILFNFLIGNEDMHLKNFSLIRRGSKIMLAPAYDFLNTTLALENAQDEIALPLHGKRTRLNRKDFVDYYAKERLKLNDTIIEEIFKSFETALPVMHELIDRSFLCETSKSTYQTLLKTRWNKLK